MRLLLPGLILLGLFSQADAGARHGRTTLDEAVSDARNQYDGRVISAETRRRDDGRDTYNIRILTPEGRVRRYQIDAESGRRIPPKRRR